MTPAKLKLLATLTTVAMFALPAAEALANRTW
jgi:hypothetical protein